MLVYLALLFTVGEMHVLADDQIKDELTTEDIKIEQMGESNGVLVKFKNQKAGAEYLTTIQQDMVMIGNHIKGIDVWL